VEFDQPPTISEFIDFEYYLKGLLGVKMDLVMRRALEGEIGKQILKEVRPG
jgi:predicted nucleotidyltransferase